MQNLLTRLSLLLVITVLGFGRSNPDRSIAVPQEEFAARRTQFFAQMTPGEVAILHSAPTANRNGDVDFQYRQDSDFYYLTGWTEPDAILVMEKQKKTGDTQASLYVNQISSHMSAWVGNLPGVAEAQALAGIDTAFAIEEFDDARGKFLYGRSKLIFSDGGDSEFKTSIDKFLSEAGDYAPAIIQRTSSVTGPLRLIKSGAEIAQLQHAIDITGESLVDALDKLRKLDYEWQLQAEIDYGFMKRGAQRLGFPSIVGSGKNSTTLHYESNNDPLDKSGLVVLDIGAEYNYYSADVTRTVPVDGKFSAEQKAIYELVLEANLAAIEAVKPDVGFRDPHKVALRTITEGLVKLGLLTGDVDTLIAERKTMKFFMHGTSHWLGLDVHDVGGYHKADGSPWQLQPGMVLTIEPGIYIKDGLEGVDPKWYNIGVRIEDDVLVTPDGHKVLSGAIPKTVKAIEKAMR